MSLQLITTEKFGDLDCNFYRNMNDEVLVTREQIGSALEYDNPMIAISKIHDRHKDRIDNFSVLTKLGGTDGKQYNTYLYTTKGIMEICRWSRQPKANAFMDFTWEVMDKLIHNKNTNSFDSNAFVSAMNLFQSQLDSVNSNIKKLTDVQQFTGINKWKRKIFAKCNLIGDYLNIPFKTVLSNLYIETENIYEIDFCEYSNDCSIKTGLMNPSTLDIIDINLDLRKMFECTIDSILDKYKLKYSKEKRNTIFDEIN